MALKIATTTNSGLEVPDSYWRIEFMRIFFPNESDNFVSPIIDITLTGFANKQAREDGKPSFQTLECFIPMEDLLQLIMSNSIYHDLRNAAYLWIKTNDERFLEAEDI